MNTKRIVGRALDLAVIAMLVFGSGDVRLFATLLAAAMALVALLGLVSLTKAAALEIHGTPKGRVVGWAVTLAYTAALVAAGSPVVAVFYLAAIVCLRFRAETVATE